MFIDRAKHLTKDHISLPIQCSTVTKLHLYFGVVLDPFAGIQRSRRVLQQTGMPIDIDRTKARICWNSMTGCDR
jgi:hypothetical protein